MRVYLYDIDNIAGLAVFACFFGAVSVLAVYCSLSGSRWFIRCLALVVGATALMAYAQFVWNDLSNAVAIIAAAHFTLMSVILVGARSCGLRLRPFALGEQCQGDHGRDTNKIFLRDLLLLTGGAALLFTAIRAFQLAGLLLGTERRRHSATDHLNANWLVYPTWSNMTGNPDKAER